MMLGSVVVCSIGGRRDIIDRGIELAYFSV
jgi:hypothetical protein